MTNPFVDKDSELEYGLKAKDVPAIIIPSKPLIALTDLVDLQPALNGESRYQKDWITYFNRIGKRAITAPDIYQAGKDGSKELLESLREDFDKYLLASGTRLIYNPNDLSVKVVHNFKSTVAKPQEIAVAEVPEYTQTRPTEVLNGSGLAYAQALFDTNDTASQMISTLEQLSQTEAKNIGFFTPTMEYRKQHTGGIVSFSNEKTGFLIEGFNEDEDGYGGRSRGVRFK